jgi:hypothetical protein
VGPGCQPPFCFILFPEIIISAENFKKCVKKCEKCKLNFVGLLRPRSSEEKYSCL